MSYAEISDYLSYLKKRSDSLDVQIDWATINPKQIVAFSPGKRIGLMITDSVASGFFRAVEPSQYGYTEDRYARMLKPVVYNHKGRFLGYGLKFWPPDDKLLERMAWLGEYEDSGTQEPTR